MKKEQKKEFEVQIIRSIEQLLSAHDAKAAEKVKKHIKDAGKTVARKFYKAAKSNAAQVVKMTGKAKQAAAKPAVAVAAVTTKSVKKVTPKKAQPSKPKSK